MRRAFRGLDDKRAARETAQAQKDDVITRRVARYAQDTPAADRCLLPGTWRLRHDEGASGEPAGDGPFTAGEAEPVDDAEAIGTVEANYKSCRFDKRRLADLQERWRLIEESGCAGAKPHDATER